MASNVNDVAVADSLKDLIHQTLENKCGLELTGETSIDSREIIEYNSRMRVGGLEKFNGPCFTIGFNYYVNEQDQLNDQPAGTIIFFIDEECVERLLKSLEHRGFDEDDQKFVLQHLGEFCQSLSLDFAQRLQDLGYSRLILSESVKAKNNIADGMSFPYNQYHYQELSFNVWKKKSIVVDITMAPASSIS